MKKLIKNLLAILILVALFILSYSHLYNPSSRTYSLDKTLITQISKNKSDYIEIESIPLDLINATIAVEDKRYYSHRGFDIIAMTRAAMVDIKERKFVQGGSTITQQLAKNLFLSSKKSLNRKWHEIIIARKLEKMFSKDEILEMYLNVIYYGAGAYGIKEACHTFFSKQLYQLDLEECAMLAGLPQSPSRYNPKKDIKRARKRQEVVLSIMAKHGFIN